MEVMFDKSERSSFKYWLAHWCAFQMTALNHKCWKPKYLLHDAEKPWLMLMWRDYKRVQTWHRTHNSHHIEYYRLHGKADWEAMVIDWECSHFTKIAQPLVAREELTRQVYNNPDIGNVILENINPILDKYKF